MTTGRYPVLNRDCIKYIAMFTMFLNHFALAFLDRGGFLFELFTNIGYFTAITMCYFLVEGFSYTHSKKAYAKRLLLFGLLSQIPYSMATGIYQLNMMFTLWFCFLLLLVRERVSNPGLRKTLLVVLVLATVISDWALLAAVFTLLFSIWKDSRQKLALAYGISVFLFALLNLASYVQEYAFWPALFHSLFACMGLAASGVVILLFYNGKRALKGRSFSKWFFYLFYPAHLLFLWILQVLF